MATPTELWTYRTLIANLTQRELKARYKRSVLGWLWSLLNPAATLGVYTLVFGVFFRAQPPEAANSGATVFALFLFVTRTRFGKALQASADNAEAAIYMGIDVDKAYHIAFGIGTAVTAIAGGLVATYYPFQPYVGLEFVIVMYAGVVLGGFGSIIGAFWGGMIIGLVQQMSTLVLPIQLQNTAIFVVFLLVIFLRPQGLFGRNVERV